MSATPSSNPVEQTTFDRRLLARQLHVAMYYPQSVGAPVGSAGLIGYWAPSQGRPVQRVPVPGSIFFLNRSHFFITFRNLRGWGPSSGVHLADLYRPPSEAPTLDAADEIVLSGFGGASKDLKFLIDWPGYPPQRCTIKTVSESGGPLTRHDLARQIMVAYGAFFRKVVRDKMLPSRVGFYNIALHQGSEARPDSLGIQLWQLHLVKFREPVPGDEHWVAEIDIVHI